VRGLIRLLGGLFCCGDWQTSHFYCRATDRKRRRKRPTHLGFEPAGGRVSSPCQHATCVGVDWSAFSRLGTLRTIRWLPSGPHQTTNANKRAVIWRDSCGGSRHLSSRSLPARKKHEKKEANCATPVSWHPSPAAHDQQGGRPPQSHTPPTKMPTNHVRPQLLPRMGPQRPLCQPSQRIEYAGPVTVATKNRLWAPCGSIRQQEGGALLSHAGVLSRTVAAARPSHARVAAGRRAGRAQRADRVGARCVQAADAFSHTLARGPVGSRGSRLDGVGPRECPPTLLPARHVRPRALPLVPPRRPARLRETSQRLWPGRSPLRRTAFTPPVVGGADGGGGRGTLVPLRATVALPSSASVTTWVGRWGRVV